MRIALQHVQVAVACPHCANTLEAWRIVSPSDPRMAGAGGYRDWTGYSWRNRWLAGALAMLLGSFGIHRFYLGFNGIGVLQVLLTVGSFFWLAPAVAVWAFIEGILCFCGALKDADGLPLRG